MGWGENINFVRKVADVVTKTIDYLNLKKEKDYEHFFEDGHKSFCDRTYQEHYFGKWSTRRESELSIRNSANRNNGLEIHRRLPDQQAKCQSVLP